MGKVVMSFYIFFQQKNGGIVSVDKLANDSFNNSLIYDAHIMWIDMGQ